MLPEKLVMEQIAKGYCGLLLQASFRQGLSKALGDWEPVKAPQCLLQPCLISEHKNIGADSLKEVLSPSLRIHQILEAH